MGRALVFHSSRVNEHSGARGQRYSDFWCLDAAGDGAWAVYEPLLSDQSN